MLYHVPGPIQWFKDNLRSRFVRPLRGERGGGGGVGDLSGDEGPPIQQDVSVLSALQTEVLTSSLIYLTMLDKWLNPIHLANSSSWCLRPF